VRTDRARSIPRKVHSAQRESVPHSTALSSSNSSVPISKDRQHEAGCAQLTNGLQARNRQIGQRCLADWRKQLRADARYCILRLAANT